MDGNYEWNRHYTQQKIESRLRDGELFRQAAAARPPNQPTTRERLQGLFYKVSQRLRYIVSRGNVDENSADRHARVSFAGKSKKQS